MESDMPDAFEAYYYRAGNRGLWPASVTLIALHYYCMHVFHHTACY